MFEGKQLAFIRSRPTLLGTSKESKYDFKKCGKSGIQISNLLPNLQTVADDMCFIRTLHTEQFNHAPAQMFMQTGFERFGRPSLGGVDELWDRIAQTRTFPDLWSWSQGNIPEQETVFSEVVSFPPFTRVLNFVGKEIRFSFFPTPREWMHPPVEK